MIYSKIYQYLWMRRAPAYRGKIFRYRQGLEQNQRLTAAQVQELQWQQLKQLLDHAYAKVPFYRRRLDEAGLPPQAIKSPDDFRRVPILTRQDLQAHLDDLVAENCDRSKLRRNSTSGSTGNPTVFYQDVRHQTCHEASKLRFRAWAGFEMGDKVAYLWGASRDIAQRNWLEQQRLHFVDRKLWLNAFDLTTDKMEEFAHQLLRWQPKYIISYVSAMYVFAGFLRERQLDRIRPVAIETSAEKLWDFQRELIEDVFQCPVVDAYGSREIPTIAAGFKPHEGLHIFSDICYLELLQNEQPVEVGQIGEIIVTDLNNYAMPLIRYQNGDLARAGQKSCSCGLPFPLLAEIMGRSNTLISTPGGKYVHGAFLSYLLYSVEGVNSFQIHQKSLTDIDISLESNGLLKEEDILKLEKTISQQLGPGIEVNLQVVDRIPRTPTGKHRYIVSDVPLPFVSGR